MATSVVTKATKEFVDQTGRRKVKGNMDIELAVDAMEIAGTIDHMVLFSGDGDFRSLVEAVQRKGVRVTVVSTISTQPPMVADELRRQADVFIDIVELQSKIGRDPSERAAREARDPRDDRASGAAHAAIPATPAARRSAPALLPAPTTTTKTSNSGAQWSARDGKPGRDCPRCPRLAAFRKTWRAKEPTWFNAPVPSFGSARRAPVDRRPGARPAGRQSHRPAVHRRLCRRSALRRRWSSSASRAAITARIPTTDWS